MKSKLFTATMLASALFISVWGTPALAQNTQTPGIDRAQQAIGARIQQGMASGHITPSEARELYRRDRDIQMRESHLKSSGNIYPQERQQLRADLERLANEVERMMANNDVVGQGRDNTPGVDNLQVDISKGIDQGVRAGRLTQREARRLQLRERAIARKEANFKSDGVVTPQERRQLRDELNSLRDELERMLHGDRRVQ